MKSPDDLRKLLAQKTWDKDIALWIGPVQPMRALVAGAGQPIAVSELDILDLLSEQSLPDSDCEIGANIKIALRADLQKKRTPNAGRRLLIVRSAALLTRYAVGLKEFFDWYLGDHAMVILILDGIPAQPRQIPAEIELRTDLLLQSFTSSDLAKNVFKAS